MLLMGTRLPPYGQNAKRAKAWGRACMQDSERSASHRSRRSVPRSWQKSLLPLRHGRTGQFPCAHECRCSVRWPLGTRLVIKGVEKELRKDNYGVLGLLVVR